MKIHQPTVLAMSLALAFIMSACSNGTSPQTLEEHAHDHAHETHGSAEHHHGDEVGHSHEHGDLTHSHDENTANDYIVVRDYRFKLAPDIGQDSVTHLDLYLKDAEGNHASGAEIKLVLTTPQGEKQEFQLQEDVAGEHYHTKAILPEPGRYDAVAKAVIGGEKYNPRFSFENN